MRAIHPTFEPKGRAQRPHPSGSFFSRHRPHTIVRSISSRAIFCGRTCFHLLLFGAKPVAWQRAQLAFASPENVQCRSVFIHILRVLVRRFPVARPPTSNPFLTHGTVESLAKLCPVSSSVLLKGRDRGRLQSVLRALRQPLSLADDRAPQFRFSSCSSGSSRWPVAQTSVVPGNRCLGSSHTRPLWPACRPALWSQSPCWSWPLCD